MSSTSQVILRRIEHRPVRHNLQTWYSEIGANVRNKGPKNNNLRLGTEYIASFLVTISIFVAIGTSLYLGLISYVK